MTAGHSASSPTTSPKDQPIAVWLLVCCAMIFIMVVIGGVTRLTHSGLSMVEWKPVTGWLPPLNDSAWQETFEKYQHYPEFQKLNRHMTLSEFKGIFWLEFIHRVWGRLLGFVFLLPFLYFLARGRVHGRLLPRLLAMFALGAAQGVLGWYMVMSGLVDRPDVSQYRLTAHLVLAFLVYGYILWVALDLLRPRSMAPPDDTHGGLRMGTFAVLVLIAVTIVSGGFVAGLDAGFAYNTFPLMGGRIVPEHVLAMEPIARNFFENIATVQFTHRVLAILSLVTVSFLWFRGLKQGMSARRRLSLHAMPLAALLQVVLGISTLILIVPVPLAAAHQAGALVLFTAVLWHLHELFVVESEIS